MKTVDVSGMGGGYEHTCQKMIEAAMKFFKENGVPELSELKDDENQKTKELEKVIIAASDNDCTGAMFYTARNHAYQRCLKGDEWYFDQFRDTPDCIYDWDGTHASVPKTDLSRKMDA